MWLVLITAPSSRTPALNYLSRRLPRSSSGSGGGGGGAGGDDALTAIIGGHDAGLMVRGFAAALSDETILVQRGILDLLLSALPLDSASLLGCTPPDRVLLARAALGVVLRRDLSLSRRLYTWLLGPSDSSEQQLAFLRAHGLDLLAAALRDEMRAEGARGFKVFISLLDKWEIGALLTERCVVDAAKALKAKLEGGEGEGSAGGAGGDELLMTGNMLLEVLDPFLLWRQLYDALRAELDPERDQHSTAPAAAVHVVELARFVVRTFRMHDDEVLRLHAPVVAFALLDLVHERVGASPSSSAEPRAETLAAAVTLATELLAEVPPAFFAPSPSAHSPEGAGGKDALTGAALAAALYAAPPSSPSASPNPDAATSPPGPPPIDARALLSAGLARALALVESSTDARVPQLLHPAARAIDLLLDLAAEAGGPVIDVGGGWDPAAWTEGVLERLAGREASVARFGADRELVRLVLRLSGAGGVRPGIRGQGRVAEALAEKVRWSYLPLPLVSWRAELS